MKLSIIFRLLPQNLVYAHCDIPCGIYDPHNAQLATHTVIRMTQMLEEIKGSDKKAMHDVARITHVKEEHSSLIEEELMTLKNDYFKKEVVEKMDEEPWPLFKKALVSCAKARQGIDMEAAKETLESVMQIAEMFYKSKGLSSTRVKAPYPTGLDIVVQKA
jgi:nickel superoxide dismutase